jgi:hypothetical protein
MPHIPDMLEGAGGRIIKPGIEMKKKQDSGDQKQCIKFEPGMHVRRISVVVEMSASKWRIMNGWLQGCSRYDRSR